MQDNITIANLTPDVMTLFASIISRGNHYVTACKALKIHYSTFRYWMEIGKSEQEGGIHREFYDLVQQADAAGEMHAVEEWRSQFKTGHQAPKDFLARRYPERWGDKKQMMLEVQRQVEHMLRELKKRLPPDIYKLVVNEIIEIGKESNAEVEEVGVDV